MSSPPPEPTWYDGWRGKHWITEGGRPTAWIGAPAIIPPYSPTVALSMTRSIQLMSFDLMKRFCSAVNGDRWRILHGYTVAMNNGEQNGFGPTPHVDYVSEYPQVVDDGATLPRYDKMQRQFQGSFMTAKVGFSAIAAISGFVALAKEIASSQYRTMHIFRKSFMSLTTENALTCTPGIDAIDARNFSYEPGMDSLLQQIIDKRWYSIAICTGDPPFHFRGQWGSNCWIVYPFILDRPVTFERRFFERWYEQFLPEPLKSYTESIG